VQGPEFKPQKPKKKKKRKELFKKKILFILTCSGFLYFKIHRYLKMSVSVSHRVISLYIIQRGESPWELSSSLRV
jgi:ABC-type polysaccharide transport system permease subunit